MAEYKQCQTCAGKGSFYGETCETCGGVGRVVAAQALDMGNRPASIGDDPDFHVFLAEYGGAGSVAERDISPATVAAMEAKYKQLISYIDAWAARRAVPEVVQQALDIALDLAIAEADNVHKTYAGYKQHKHDAADRDVETIKRAIDAINPAADSVTGGQ